jgi:hypothetical protein
MAEQTGASGPLGGATDRGQGAVVVAAGAGRSCRPPSQEEQDNRRTACPDGCVREDEFL